MVSVCSSAYETSISTIMPTAAASLQGRIFFDAARYSKGGRPTRSVAPYVLTQREGLRKNQGDNTKQKQSTKQFTRWPRNIFCSWFRNKRRNSKRSRMADLRMSVLFIVILTLGGIDALASWCLMICTRAVHRADGQSATQHMFKFHENAADSSSKACRSSGGKPFATSESPLQHSRRG